MIYFLCRRFNTYPDIVTLCSETGWKILSKRGYDYFINDTRKKLTFERGDIAVRWGAFFNIPLPTVNSAKAVSFASNKRRARKILHEAGVSIPQTWYDLKHAKMPFIARPSRHSGGHNFFIVRNKEDLGRLRSNLNGWYFSELIDSSMEYRVYVGHGKVSGAYKKKFLEGEVRANRAITGLDWGEMVDAPLEVQSLAVDSCKALELDTGAVDIIIGDKPYIVEINTTPTISNSYTRDMYIKYFKKCIS